MGMVISTSASTGTFGVAPQDAGVASVTAYLAANLPSARLIGRQALTALALAHGYDTAFWWTTGILASGAVIGGALLRPGPLARTGTPSPAEAEAPAAQAETGPSVRHDPAVPDRSP
jgi:hypothetical protein